jgi:hypothetical protein
VAKAGGQFTSVQAAINSITDASDSNRYLVWVAPGTYNEQVTVKDFVGLQGAGENLTKIISSDPDGTVLTLAQGASLRDLTVEGKDRAILTYGGDITEVTARINTDNKNCIGIFALGGARLSHVTVKISSTPQVSGGQAVGILNNDAAGVSVNNSRVEVDSSFGASGGQFLAGRIRDSVFNVASTNSTAVGVHNSNQLTLDNVTIEANSNALSIGLEYLGIFLNPLQSTIKNSSITVVGSGQSYGIYMGRGLLDVQNSEISAPTNTITVLFQATVRVTHSLLGGGPAVNAAGTTLKCSAVTDENYDFFANTCP